MMLRYPSSMEKTGSWVFAPAGKSSTALRSRDIFRNHLAKDHSSKVGIGKYKSIVLKRKLLISIPLALILGLLSILRIPAVSAHQAFDISTTLVRDFQPLSPPPQKMKLVRKFVVDRTVVATITGYTNSLSETGKTPGSRYYGITSTGTSTQQGRTIAVDPKLIPYGSTVRINGNLYHAEDTGEAIHGYRIDIYFEKVNDALQWGRRQLPIEIGHFEDQWISDE